MAWLQYGEVCLATNTQITHGITAMIAFVTGVVQVCKCLLRPTLQRRLCFACCNYFVASVILLGLALVKQGAASGCTGNMFTLLDIHRLQLLLHKVLSNSA